MKKSIYFISIFSLMIMLYVSDQKNKKLEKIGIVNGDKNDRVYEYREHSTDEWIISFYKSGEMDNSMLMKEINVTEIPDNLQYDYK